MLEKAYTVKQINVILSMRTQSLELAHRCVIARL